MLCVFLGLALFAAQGSAVPDSDFSHLAAQAAAALDKDPATAAKLYRQALATKPDWAEGWFYLGASEYQTKRYVQAREAFEKATQLVPENGPAWAFLGLAESSAGDGTAALPHLLHGIDLGVNGNPGFAARVQIETASLLCQQKQFGEALTHLGGLARQGDRSEPVIADFGLAVLQIAKVPGQLRGSERTMVEEAGRAVWEMYTDRPEQGIPLLRGLAEHYPRQPGVHYAYGMALLAKSPELALNQLRLELQINPRHPNAAVQAALLEMKSGDDGQLQDAVRLSRGATEAMPDYSLAHAVLGRALLKQGKVQPALAELETAVRQDSETAQFHLYLQQAYMRAGRTQDAERELAEYQRLHAAMSPDVNSGARP